jgi:activator of HSP90 ATPase
VAIEASSLYSLLTSLRFRVEGARSDDTWFIQAKLLGTENGPLDQFKDVLEKMVGTDIVIEEERPGQTQVWFWRANHQESFNSGWQLQEFSSNDYYETL